MNLSLTFQMPHFVSILALFVLLADLPVHARPPQQESGEITYPGTKINRTPPCIKPEYPKEALLQGLAGTSMLNFLIDTDGTVLEARAEFSSGSSLLDETALRALSTCTFVPDLKEGKPVQTWSKMAYIWIVEDQPDSYKPYRLHPIRCWDNSRFIAQAEKDDNFHVALRIKMRTERNANEVVRLEKSSGFDDIDRAAVTFAEACRWRAETPAGATALSTGLVYIRAKELRAGVIPESEMRAVYDRALPGLQAEIKGKTQYEAFQITTRNEEDARKIMALIVEGNRIERLAFRYSVDGVRNKGGKIGWMTADDGTVVDKLLLASAADKKPRLAQAGDFWVILYVRATRPGEAPSFAEMRDIIERKLREAGPG